MPKRIKPRLIPTVQLFWLVCFLAASLIAFLKSDWTGFSIALLWACLDAVALRVAFLEKELKEKTEQP